MASIGSTPGIIIGAGVGAAASTALTPAFEPARQNAWKQNPVKLLDPAVMARLVAQGGLSLGTAYSEAALDGYSSDKVDALVYLSQTVPGFGQAVTALRRGKITPEEFGHTLVKAGMDARYYPAIEDLQHEWLTPAQVALGIVRGTIPDPGILPVTLDTTGTIKGYPQFTENDAYTEALGGGIDKERLTAIVGSIGLPMSLQQAASAVFRGIIERGDFNRAVLESDTRPEWAEAIFAQAHEILTAGQYTELELRGYYDRATRLKNTEKHGMSDADSDLLYNVMGRSIPVHQITTGLARGGKYPGKYANIPSPYKESIQRSNIREEYAELAYENRFSYPSLFQLNALVKAKAIDAPTAEDWATKSGLAPEVVTALGVFWRSETGAAPATAAKSATTSAVRAIQKAYVQGNTTRAEATASLTTLGEDAASLPALFTAWDVSKTAYLQGLSNVQIRNRYRNQGLTEAEALALLEDRGLDAATATAYLTG